MIIGYTKLPGAPEPAAIDRVRQDLIEAGAEIVYVDTQPQWHPAGTGQAPHGLEAALGACAAGDTLMTPTPAQLAGSVGELIAIAERLTSRGATLRVLQIAGGQMLDTGTASGTLLLGALGLLAAFDRQAAPGSQGAGSQALFSGLGVSRPVPVTTDNGFAPRRPRGRPPTATTQANEIARLRAAGMRATDIADRLKICRASVYRVLNLATSDAPTVPASRVQEPASADRQTDYVPLNGHDVPLSAR